MAKKKSDEKVADGGENKNDANEMNHNDEPDFDDPPNFVDDISDEELLGDLLRQKPQETDGVENVIVVDGVPQVGKERLEKLQSVIMKIFSKFGPIVNEYYPKKEDGSTKGYIFLEYSNPENALDAVNVTNNYKLDKQHTFQVNLFTDFDKYANIPIEWEPPTPQPYKVETDLHSYLMDPDAYDQFSVVCNSDSGAMQVQIWQNSQPEPTKLENRDNFTDEYVKWSPLGTYLVTFHRLGVVLWGGPNFTRIARFSHPCARFIDFSPCENYLVTYSGMPDEQKIIIWDIRTGQEKRSFLPEGPKVWPIFRWSKDDKYLARMGIDILSVYETPSFGLLDKKSIKVPGIRDFQWSPTDNILAYWVAEDKDGPARVTLLEIPNRNEIRNKNLFNVADCKIHWQKSGDFLCVKVDRYAKLRKDKNEVIGGEIKYSGMYYNFEIFHMREKEIPVDSVEIKEPIHAFAWEPIGSKFAIIHGESSIASISFYEAKTGQPPSVLKKFEKRPFTHLFWSPMGQFVVFAQLVDQLGQVGMGALEFVDTNDFIVMNSTDHFQATDVEWDPTGRYIVTGVSGWKVKHDTGYWIWTFQGRILKRVNLDKFKHFLWRPRPSTLLSIKEQKEIKKNIKKYSAQFESKDRMRLTKASKELLEKRASLMKQFQEYRVKRKSEWESQKSHRMELRMHIDTDNIDSDTTNVEEEVVEFLIKEETAIIE